MMRSQKTEENIHAEINQICMNITHDHTTLRESLHVVISQREGLVKLCKSQRNLLDTLISFATTLNLSPELSSKVKEVAKLRTQMTDALKMG